MGYLSLTDADRAEMLAAIGVSSIDELFEQIPPGVRFDRELDVPPALSELELVAHISDLAATERALGCRAVVPRCRNVRPLRSVGRRRAALARGVPDRVHPVSARDEPGRAAGDLRVPDGHLRADGDGRLERVGVRRLHRRRRRVLRRQAHERPQQGRPRRDAEPAGAAGGQDIRARLRSRGRRGSASRWNDRSRGGRGGGGRRRRLHLPAAELLRMSRARTGARRRGSGRWSASDRPCRPHDARCARGPGRVRLCNGRRGRAERRLSAPLRRAPLRILRSEAGVRPPDAGTHRRARPSTRTSGGRSSSRSRPANSTSGARRRPRTSRRIRRCSPSRGS